MFSYSTGIILGSIAAIAATILLYIKVLPRKLDGSFQNKWLQFLHDFFHFKKLYLEEVLKFFFVLATVTCVCVGIFMLVSYDESYHYSRYGSYTTKESMFLYGLLLIVGGPISLRLVYEGIMMFILLVKNVMDLNNKVKAPKETPKEIPEETPAE